jgi:hypothetical protein
LVPLIVSAFRQGSGAAAWEALVALTHIAPSDEGTVAILAEALVRDAELAANAAEEIVRLKLIDHPIISRAVAESTTARAVLDRVASVRKPV